MRARIAVIVAGIALIIVGLALGLSSSSIQDSSFPNPAAKALSCGSPWAPRYAEASKSAFLIAPADAKQQCRDAHGARGALGLVVLALGALAVLSVGIAALLPRQAPPVDLPPPP